MTRQLSVVIVGDHAADEAQRQASRSPDVHPDSLRERCAGDPDDLQVRADHGCFEVMLSVLRLHILQTAFHEAGVERHDGRRHVAPEDQQLVADEPVADPLSGPQSPRGARGRQPHLGRRHGRNEKGVVSQRHQEVVLPALDALVGQGGVPQALHAHPTRKDSPPLSGLAGRVRGHLACIHGDVTELLGVRQHLNHRGARAGGRDPRCQVRPEPGGVQGRDRRVLRLRAMDWVGRAVEPAARRVPHQRHVDVRREAVGHQRPQQHVQL
mmetsp:Transcript_129046/g.361076  ORF Transcript_129046/g.361076 Transcript_129046/m.361076 type:complete len:268 (+) Transcript_129046:104-907(+)